MISEVQQVDAWIDIIIIFESAAVLDAPSREIHFFLSSIECRRGSLRGITISHREIFSFELQRKLNHQFDSPTSISYIEAVEV